MRTKSNNLSRQSNGGLRNPLQKTHSHMTMLSQRSASKKQLFTQRDNSQCSDSTLAESNQVFSSSCNEEHVS